MGESKLPKTPPKRPGADLLGLKSSVSGWESGVMGVSDPDTNDFMKALRNALKWIEELEAATDPFAKVVPMLDPALPDTEPVFIFGQAALTVGDFRRLNPNAVKAALDS